ncbi:MAG: glycosyltransferase family 2 protein [Bacteroidota bacterium]
MTGKKLNEPNSLPDLHIAIPLMDEPDLLTRTLECIAAQSYLNFKVYICVNQPENWWDDPIKSSICRNNARSLEFLSGFKLFDLLVLDHSSRGRGWKGKRYGVGYARKALMDEICNAAQRDDIIISLDADTTFPADYLLSVAMNFREHPEAVALSVPYFHHTVSDEIASRAILRYEIYMRHYFLNLMRIGSPYTFTALGSAMAFPVWAYRATGGLTPKMSGEDFYFLQKLRKYGPVILWNDVVVHPEARFSDRVFFGTGPAMIKGATGDWSSYPVYPANLFNALLETYLLLPVLYIKTIETQLVKFFIETSTEKDPFRLLRDNHKDMDHFIRAFHEKLDGLRILQYLKSLSISAPGSDETNLRNFFAKQYPGSEINLKTGWASFSFESSPQAELEKIRSFLFEKEMEQRFNSTMR